MSTGEAVLTDLPVDLQRKILELLPLPARGRISSLSKLHKENYSQITENDKINFDLDYSAMISAYYKIFASFVNDPDVSGTDIQLSIRLDDGPEVFYMNRDNRTDIPNEQNNILAAAMTNTRTIKVTFIKNPDYKEAWKWPCKNLLEWESEVSEAKIMLQSFYNRFSKQLTNEIITPTGLEFVKFLVAYLLISRYKIVFESKEGNYDIYHDYFITVDHFDLVEQFPVDLVDTLELETINRIAGIIKDGGIYEPIIGLETHKETINGINLKDLKKNGNLGFHGIFGANVELEGDVHIIYKTFFESISNFTYYNNKNTFTGGVSNKKKSIKKPVKLIYTKTERRFTKNNNSSIVYTRGIYDYIRVKDGNVYNYKKIKRSLNV